MAAPSLNRETTAKIELLIISWQTKLTWDLLVKSIELDLDIKTTRQTLNSYASIKNAYALKKQDLRGSPPKEFFKFSKKDMVNFERIQRLESEKESLERKLGKQLAFIKEIVRQSETNPLLTQLLNQVKKSIETD